jgi:hypothetical protein
VEGHLLACLLMLRISCRLTYELRGRITLLISSAADMVVFFPHSRQGFEQRQYGISRGSASMELSTNITPRDSVPKRCARAESCHVGTNDRLSRTTGVWRTHACISGVTTRCQSSLSHNSLNELSTSARMRQEAAWTYQKRLKVPGNHALKRNPSLIRKAVKSCKT